MSVLPASTPAPPEPWLDGPADSVAAARRWWGPVVLHSDGARYFRIGPFELWFERHAGQWTAHHRSGRDPRDERLEIDRDGDDADVPAVPDAGCSVVHFALPADAQGLSLQPLLADRSVVLTPARPLILQAGGSAMLFAASPIWLALNSLPDQRLLLELPLLRPSDTWFGDTNDGELCYASRLLAAREVSELLRLPHRAITPLHITNARSEPMLVERINVPVRSLSLFQSSDGQLWTEPVRLTSERGSPLATVTRSGAAPAEALAATRVAEPRDPSGMHFSARVFFGFLGGGNG